MAVWTRWALSAGVLVGGVALGEALCRLLTHWRPWRQARISLRLLFFVAAALGAAYLAAPVLGLTHERDQPEHMVLRTLWAVGVLVAVVVAARLFEAFFLEGVLRARAETAVPTLARQIAFLVLIVVAVLTVLDVYFKTPPSTLLASSVVISAVVGLSLQQTLGSVVAGVALQSEQVFRLGEWVAIDNVEGEVVRMTWRTIHLRTRQHDIVIIPNDQAARGTVVNYSRPTRIHATSLEVGVHYRHSPDFVRHVLREATLAARGVLVHPEPHFWVVNYGDFAITYRIKFFLDDYAGLHDIQAAVMSNIWYHFRRHGIEIPFPIRTVSMTQVTPESRAREAAERQDAVRRALRAADLFRPLTDAEIEALAARVETLPYGAGERLFAQGDGGACCYLIERGRVAVRAADASGHEVHLADLGPGAILGEMSLLTGAPRSATAVAVEETAAIRIGHDAFGAVLAANPAIAEALAALLETRQAATAEALKAAGQAKPHGELLARRRRLVHDILRVFGLASA